MKSEDNGHAESSKKWLEDVRDGRLAREFETTALQGLQVVRAQKGSMLCNFTVPKAQSDEKGNWVAGAMAALIDDVGAAAIVSIVDRLHVSVSFDISFFSTAKIQEELEIEAYTLGNNGKLCSVEVRITRKTDGKLIALGKQWMLSATNVRESAVDGIDRVQLKLLNELKHISLGQ
ncbi:hypothetical protein Sjap_019988 [Stephania japonica]|uniref:Acyl-coenzyme A thioesterase 13 n=1 Tax=Stephania japonica TaxID=461633 RepID=A0AAP0I0B4_9MAGN